MEKYKQGLKIATIPNNESGREFVINLKKVLAKNIDIRIRARTPINPMNWYNSNTNKGLRDVRMNNAKNLAIYLYKLY